MVGRRRYGRVAEFELTVAHVSLADNAGRAGHLLAALVGDIAGAAAVAEAAHETVEEASERAVAVGADASHAVARCRHWRLLLLDGLGELLSGLDALVQASLRLQVDLQVDERHDEERHEEGAHRRVDAIELVVGYVTGERLIGGVACA